MQSLYIEGKLVTTEDKPSATLRFYISGLFFLWVRYALTLMEM